MKLKTIFLSLFFLAIFLNVNAQETVWKIDKSHSNISFEIKHFKIATVKGNFNDFSGKIMSQGEDFTTANFEVVIKTVSINTNQEDRDKHLRSADFFNAELNPEIIFKSTSVIKESNEEYKIKGDITINGVTKQIEFAGKFAGSFVHPRFKTTIGVFHLEGSLPRLDYNIGSKFSTIALGENVKISIDIEMTKSEN